MASAPTPQNKRNTWPPWLAYALSCNMTRILARSLGRVNDLPSPPLTSAPRVCWALPGSTVLGMGSIQWPADPRRRHRLDRGPRYAVIASWLPALSTCGSVRRDRPEEGAVLGVPLSLRLTAGEMINGKPRKQSCGRSPGNSGWLRSCLRLVWTTKNPRVIDLGVSAGAGDENRTRALSLGS